MAFQGEREQGGLDVCFDVESMARDGSFYKPTANYNQWGSSPPYTEHGLCRQTNSESHNSGAIAPQRNTEQAAIISATNGTTRGECFQPPLQTTGAWQAKQEAGACIDGLRRQVSKSLQRWRNGDNCIGELHSFSFELDEARRRVDRVHEDYVRTESQQLADAQERAESELKKRIEEQKRKHDLEVKKTKGRGRRRYSEKEKLGRGGRKRTGMSETIERKSKLGV